MKKRIITALLTVIMTAAFLPLTASAEATENNSDHGGNILPYSEYDGISKDMPNIIGARMYAEPGETVSYPVYMYQNPGYLYSGISMDFDDRLIPVLNEKGKVTMGIGPASDDLAIILSSNLKNGIKRVGLATGAKDSDNKPETDDGKLFYAQFTVPEDAEKGTCYDMKLRAVELTGEDEKEIAYNLLDGWIRVGDPEDQPVAGGGAFMTFLHRHTIAFCAGIAAVTGIAAIIASGVLKRKKGRKP